MSIRAKSILLLLLMLASAALAAALRPTQFMADQRPVVKLAELVPKSFDGWVELPDSGAQIVNPQQQALIEQIYSDTLSRNYVNRQGYRIMLTIAYGKNQSDALQLHKPEVCYPAQGFTLLNKQDVALSLMGKSISAVRIDTQLQQRAEPVLYWTVVGDHVIKPGLDKKWVEMRYALQDIIPDGMLIRVSSIDPDKAQAQKIQNAFAQQLVQAIAPENRKRFAGDPLVN